MDKILISPIDSVPWFALTASFLFEMLVRRNCSTLKSDLNFSPTDVFPFFPVPWTPRFDDNAGRPSVFPISDNRPISALGHIGEELLSYRTSLLKNPGCYEIDAVGSQWGPTKLYNLYDDPNVNTAAIQKLRKIHARLLQVVLEAYGWDDLVDPSAYEHWTFARPWIDRSTRFVPPESVRKELFVRLEDLNHERYQYELELYLPRIAGLLRHSKPLSRNKIKKIAEVAGIDINEETLLRTLALGVSKGILKKDTTRRYSRWMRV